VESAHDIEIRRARVPVRTPTVQLGALRAGGLAPAFLAVIERGVNRRPSLAADLRAEIELSAAGNHPPVRIVFGETTVLVEDGPGKSPDVRIAGALADLVSLMVAPSLGGLPIPAGARGRAAVGLLLGGRVRVRGRLGLLRRFLALIRV